MSEIYTLVPFIEESGLKIKSIQRGQVSLWGSSPSVDVTIASVNLAKSVLNLNGSAAGGSSASYVSGWLTTSTNIHFQGGQITFNTNILGWEVIEYV